MRYIALLSALIWGLSGCTEQGGESTGADSDSASTVESLFVKDTVYESPHGMEMRFPIISAPGSALDSLIYEHLSFYAVTGLELPDVLNPDPDMLPELDEIDFYVNYNEKGVFDIQFSVVYLGAHLHYDTRFITLDLMAGKPLLLRDLLAEDKLSDFIADCQVQLDMIAAGGKEEVPEEDEDLLEFFDGHEVSENTLEYYSLSEDGITVHYRFEFPHFMRVYEPLGNLDFTWEEMSSYLNADHPVVQRLIGAS